MTNFDKDANAKKRRIFRIVGFILLGIGAVFTILFFISFFSAFGDFDSGDSIFKDAWMPFVGFPLMAIGGVFLKFGYMGSLFKYFAEETVPTAAKSANYILNETKDNIKDILGTNDKNKKQRVCPKCGALNEIEDKYCFDCGAKLKD
ncbi:MAG: zinc ribbon domain-containing protein [Acholeplasma sp.]|nr:zinc ribbon domain-containing protein [Acholeplasma sp.]